MRVSMPQGQEYIERMAAENRISRRDRQAKNACNKDLVVQFSFYWPRGGISFTTDF